MDGFLQRMIERLHEQFFHNMSSERRSRKLSVMRALARASFRNKDKENEDPTNNNMALPFHPKHSTPLRSHQITDLDVEAEPEPEPELLLKEDETCLGDEREVVESRPQFACGACESSFEEFRDDARGESVDPPARPGPAAPPEQAGVDDDGDDDGGDDGDDQSRRKAADVPERTAEKEFFRSLEESKLYVSTSSLLEEIEADLPSSCSLARPLDHTLYTLSSYRTLTRLARMANLTFPGILEQRESLEGEASSERLEYLEREAVVQRSLASQAEKALALSRSRKFLGVEHLECEKALLLANLRHSAAVREAERLKFLGEGGSEREHFGQLTISEMFFAVENSSESGPGWFICAATERENVQSTSVFCHVSEGLVHFDQPLKFQNLGKDFLVYIELFRLRVREAKKVALPTSIVRKLKKMTTVNLNKSLPDVSGDHGGDFGCVACAELRMDQIATRETEECLLYFTESPLPPVASSSVRLLVETDVRLASKSGFLNVFRQTWHRRWYLQSGYFLESWLYPEDQEAGKNSVESLYLAACVAEVKPVSLEVCVRPHSFVLRLGADEEVIFSADSHRDMLAWIGHLNLVVEHIRLWKPTL